MEHSEKRECIQKCRCCLEESGLKDLWTPNDDDGECERYGDMLTECFALSWEEPSDINSEYICRNCISRLKAAVTFKKEILYSEQLLLLKIEEEPFDNMKQETESEDEVTTEYLELVDDNITEKITTIKIEPLAKPKALKKKKKIYTEEDLQKSVEAVVKNKMSQNKASITFNVSRSAISRALGTTMKKSKSQAEKKTKTYTEEDLQKCLEDVKNGKFTQGKAALFYDIPRTTISRALMRYELNLAKPETLKNIKQYTDEDLENCLEAIKNNTFSQTKASELYKIPITTIRRELARRSSKASTENNKKTKVFSKKKRKERPISDSYLFPELKNFDSDVCVLFDCSNATPIRCRGGVGYKCCFCPQQFPDPADLKKHSSDKHENKTISTLLRGRHGSAFLLKLDISYLHCKMCDRKMETLESLINHLIADHNRNIHKDIKNFILPFKFEGEEIRCVICNSLFNKFKVLQEHMSTHFQNYICDYCGAGFVTRSILLKHMKCHLTGLFKCAFCDKTYDTVRKKRAHEIQVHIQGRMLYKCGYCSEKFNRYQKREQHLVKVHGVQSVTFKCQACDKVLVSQQALRDHTRRDHLLERQHTCPECGLNFFRPSDVRRHMVRHNGVRKFQCDVCLKSYSRLNTLREHLRIHADDRRFKCEHCGVGFVQKCSWRAHMRTKHGEQV